LARVGSPSARRAAARPLDDSLLEMHEEQWRGIPVHCAFPREGRQAGAPRQKP
jgi:hypothetical protein